MVWCSRYVPRVKWMLSCFQDWSVDTSGGGGGVVRGWYVGSVPTSVFGGKCDDGPVGEILILERYE